MNGYNSYQRKKIDINKNSYNTSDYHNNMCYRDTYDPGVMPGVNAYANYNAPCVSGFPLWPDFYQDYNELKGCLDYLEIHKKWIEKNKQKLLIYDASITLFNQLSYLQNTSMNNISDYSSKTKYYISELQKIKNEIYGYKNSSYKNTGNKILMYTLVTLLAFGILCIFVSPYCAGIVFAVPFMILYSKYGKHYDSIFDKDIFNDFLFK